MVATVVGGSFISNGDSVVYLPVGARAGDLLYMYAHSNSYGISSAFISLGNQYGGNDYYRVLTATDITNGSISGGANVSGAATTYRGPKTMTRLTDLNVNGTANISVARSPASMAMVLTIGGPSNFSALIPNYFTSTHGYNVGNQNSNDGSFPGRLVTYVALDRNKYGFPTANFPITTNMTVSVVVYELTK
ncbi:MAG: hypothetical protein EOO77_44880 [Oxalobacteraceae bacterium]|nr:MAG: hypothetical protein EOO77_44880 [Oxalobacteraceae bacterium]